MNHHRFIKTVKASLLLFWCAWFLIVTLTNLCDGLKAMGVLSPQWLFASGNYAVFPKVVARYGDVHWLAPTLFSLDILGTTCIGLCLLAGFISYLRDGLMRWNFINLAFWGSIVFFACFILMEEVFIFYAWEDKHLLFLVASVISLAAMHLLPEPVNS